MTMNPLEPDDGTHEPNHVQPDTEKKEAQSIQGLLEEQTLKKLCEEDSITPETKCKLCDETARDIYKQYDKYAITDGTFT